MTLTKRRISLLLGVTLLMTMGFIGLHRATAVTPGLYEVEGNPSCALLYEATVISGPDSDLLDLGPLLGFKYDANPTGDASSEIYDNDPWVKTSGQPDDMGNSISIFNVVLNGEGEGIEFDWSATLGLDAVIVKAQDANAYVYSPEAFGDIGLVAPDGKAVSHIEFCYDYELEAEKTATAEYTRTYTWNITKEYDGEYDKFIGDSATSHDYEVSVDQTVTDSAWAVSGTITVSNPTPFAVNFSVSDFVDGTAATVSCPTYDLAANDGAPGGADEVTCSYSASLGGAVDGTNTATITSENADVKGAVATADYTFGDPTTVVGDPDINVTDTNGESWMASGDDSWTYNRDFVCSTDPDDYTDGFYSFTHDNTATITETSQSDDATVIVNCYAPVVTKDASASYDETWTWTLEKSVDPTSQTEFAGNALDDWTWTVTVDESFVEENFAVSGTIYVDNPAGSPGDMTVSLVDQLNDGTFATVDCDGFGATSVTVASNAQGTCSYTAAPGGRTATLNTATGTFNGIVGFDGTAGVSFDNKNVVNGTATVDDNQEPDFPVNLVADDGGTRKWTETQDDTCSTDWVDYGEDGTYSETLTNDATLTSDDQNLEADAETTYTCEAGTIDVLKWTDGVVNDTQDWQFALYIGPDGFEGTQVGNTSSTSGDSDGILDFGDPIPALRPDTTYTVCELDVPAGWSTEWSIGGTTVIPYNPNANDDPSEDLGNRCFEVGAGTSYPVVVGENLRITVDNTFPGGAPRTPGYWKNWSSCTGGGQFAKTTDDVDPDNKFVSLDEILNDPGIIWDDILVDELVFDIDTCLIAVSLLDQRDIATGKKVANDAAFTLSMHLLATQLNFGAGACTTQDVLDKALAAETLLDEYDFDGVVYGNGKKAGYLTDNKNPDRAYALELADYLDRYNNGEFCGDGND